MSNMKYQGAYSRRRYSNYSSEVIGTAETAQKVTLYVDYNKTLGRVTSAGMNDGAVTAPKGTQVKLEATPIGSARFVCWNTKFKLPVAANTNPLTLTLNQNERITAVFAADLTTDEPVVVEPHVIEPPVIDPNVIDPDEKPTPVNIPDFSAGAGLVDKAVAFAKKWWWALLIAAYIVYKETKGGSK